MLAIATVAVSAQTKKVSILGDSYSTFQGMIPEGYAVYYPNNGNDVKEVSQTWWDLYIKAKGYQLETNDSWSGSTICGTGYGRMDSSGNNFISRVDKLGNPDIILIFGGTNDAWANSPIGEYQYADWTKEDCKTSLVLKMPKTESSIRDIYIPNSVAQALQELQKAQKAQKKKLHGLYHDFNMVIAQPDGRPTEGRLLDKDFKSLIETHQLPPVVFHSLRHLSTSMKLQYSGGDIKAVQGDTGHAQASMVTQVYSHTFDENRRRVASLMEKSFFRQEKGKADKQDSGDEENGEDAKTEADHKDESARNQEILKLLNQSPDLADLILALASSRTDRSSPATV